MDNPSAPLVMSSNGVAYRYAKGSDLNLPPIVLLHGLSQQSDFWFPVVNALGSRFSTVSVDLRGHGESRFMPLDYRIPQVAQDCITLLGQLEIDNACVVGHSWGASVALNIAAQKPSERFRIESCVLIDGGAFTPANIVEQGSISRDELTHALTPPLGPFTEEELQTHYLSACTGFSTHEQASVMSAIRRSYMPATQGGWVTTIGFDRHMAVLEAFLDYNPDTDLETLTIPTWILMARDAFAPRMSDPVDSWADVRSRVDYKVRGNSNIALQHWYGAVHDVPLYRPKQVSQLISHAVVSSAITSGIFSVDGGKDTLA